MTDVYEFHIAGLISPVVRSALPELVAATESRDTMLTGRVDDPADIDDLLQRLDDHGLIATHMVIGRQTRWRATPTRSRESRPRRVVTRAGPGEGREVQRNSTMERHMTLLDFEIRVTGPVPADIVGDIPGGRAVARPVEAVLRGPVTDQATMKELLKRLQALGLELVEFRRISPPPNPPGRTHGQQAPARWSPAATVPT